MSPAVPAAFLDACLRRPTPFTPIWLMRQAGRYMPEYRAVRARLGFLELCKSPEAAAEVTLQPVERLGVDAAILFADILLVLEPLGVGLEFTQGDGPRIERPVRAADDVRARCRAVDVEDALGYVFETVRRVRKALADRVPLIGFAGAPFTLASYLIEGGPSREFLPPRRFMREEPDGVGRAADAARGHHRRLPERADRRGRAGGAALRHVGRRALARRLPRATCCRTRGARSPRLRPRRAGHPLRHRHRRAAAADESGGRRRHRPRLARRARRRVGAARPRRGGAGQPRSRPCCSPPARRSAARPREILDAAAGRPGHIFNLGHGIHKDTPVDHVEGAGRHRPRAVRRDDRGARHRRRPADRLRRPGAAGGRPPVPPDRHRGPPDPAPSVSRRSRTTTS